MPYTKTPTTDTYSQEDVPLVREITSRQNDPFGTKDEALINNIVELVRDKRTQDNRTFHFKRAGSSLVTTVPGIVRGSFSWKDKNIFVYCVGSNVYMLNLTTNVTTTLSTVFSTTTGTVGFTLFLYDTGSSDIVATDGTTLVTITSGGVVTPSASADLPVPHIPTPIFLDGYIFLIKSSTADVHNSDLNSPLLWTAGNYLTTEIDGDYALDMAKVNNYIVVFGSRTIEYFYDAGEASGSPLKRNDTPVKINGFIGGIAHAGNAVFFLGYNESQQPEVYKLQDLTMESVSTDTIRRYVATSGNTMPDYYGCIVSNMGHDFYFLSTNGASFVYDIKEKLWGKWTWKSGNDFRITHANNVASSNTVYSVFTVSGENNVYRFDDSKYQDNGTSFKWTVIAEPTDFGTLNRKSMGKLAITCDRPSSDSYMTISFSDDDFKTWYGNYQVNLNQDLPSITRLGSFRQRAIKLEYTDNYPMRLQSLQANINKGRN